MIAVIEIVTQKPSFLFSVIFPLKLQLCQQIQHILLQVYLITVVHYYVDDIVGSCSPNLPHADIMGLSSNSFDQLANVVYRCLSKNRHGMMLFTREYKGLHRQAKQS